MIEIMHRYINQLAEYEKKEKGRKKLRDIDEPKKKKGKREVSKKKR